MTTATSDYVVREVWAASTIAYQVLGDPPVRTSCSSPAWPLSIRQRWPTSPRCHGSTVGSPVPRPPDPVRRPWRRASSDRGSPSDPADRRRSGPTTPLAGARRGRLGSPAVVIAPMLDPEDGLRLGCATSRPGPPAWSSSTGPPGCWQGRTIPTGLPSELVGSAAKCRPWTPMLVALGLRRGGRSRPAAWRTTGVPVVVGPCRDPRRCPAMAEPIGCGGSPRLPAPPGRGVRARHWSSSARTTPPVSARRPSTSPTRIPRRPGPPRCTGPDVVLLGGGPVPSWTRSRNSPPWTRSGRRPSVLTDACCSPTSVGSTRLASDVGDDRVAATLLDRHDQTGRGTPIVRVRRPGGQHRRRRRSSATSSALPSRAVGWRPPRSGMRLVPARASRSATAPASHTGRSSPATTSPASGSTSAPGVSALAASAARCLVSSTRPRDRPSSVTRRLRSIGVARPGGRSRRWRLGAVGTDLSPHADVAPGGAAGQQGVGS